MEAELKGVGRVRGFPSRENPEAQTLHWAPGDGVFGASRGILFLAMPDPGEERKWTKQG